MNFYSDVNSILSKTRVNGWLYGCAMAKLSEQENKIQSLFLSGVVNSENQEYWNSELSAIVYKRKIAQERLNAQLSIVEANSLPMVTPATIVQQAKHWASVIERAESPETKRNLLLARIQKIECLSKGEFEFDLVMTKSPSWLRRLDSNQRPSG